MKLPAAVLVLIFGLQAADRTPAAEPAAPAPKIVFVEREFDYGRNWVNMPVQHDFVFTNTGNAQLVISNVQPGCHCTTAAAFSNSVAPGKVGVIPIRFDGSGPTGGTIKTVVVTCNDPMQPSLNLILKGQQVMPVEPTSTFVNMTVSPDSATNESAVVNIHNNTDTPVTLGEPKSSQPGIAVELKTLKPGQDFELTIRPVARFITNTTVATVTLTTSHPAEAAFSITVVANLLPPLSVTPAQIVILPPGQSAGTNAYRVTIQNNSGKPLTLSEPVVNIWGAKVVVEETDPGKHFLLNLTLPPGFEIPPGTNYEVNVKSSNPQVALIRVPLLQLARALPPTARSAIPLGARGAPPAPPAANAAPR